MKKSQRNRLVALKAKDAASLSEAEKNELADLERLAAAHPDASADEDDTRPLSVENFMARLTAAFSAKETLARDNARLTAENARLTSELAAAQSGRSTAEQQLQATQTQLTSAQAVQTEMTAAFAAVGLAFEAGKTDAAAFREKFSAHVNTRAQEKLAELGFPAQGLPQTTPSAESFETLEEIQAQMEQERDPVKLGKLAKKANELRAKIWAN